MRVRETIVRAGYFWLPGQESYKASGNLTISDGGVCRLELLGTFSGPTGSFNDLRDGMEIGRILGHVERDGFVTLEGCFYLKRPYAFGGITKSQIRVNWAVLGVRFDPDEEILFDEYFASIEGLDEWLGISGFKLDFGNFHSFKVSYSRPDAIRLYESDEFSLSVGFSHTMPSGTSLTDARISQTAFLKASTKEPRDAAFFKRVIRKVSEFLSLAMDESVAAFDIYASNRLISVDGGDGEKKPAKMDLYFPTINFSPTPAKVEHYRMLFRFADISANSHSILESWFNLYDVIAPAMNLYFSSKAGAHRFVEGRFLALVQAIETLHRRTSIDTAMDPEVFAQVRDQLIQACPSDHRQWLEQKLNFANEVSLANRLKKLLVPFEAQFGNAKSRKRLVRALVDSRNYLTHYDDRLAGDVATGGDLWVLCEKIEALLQLHLLKTLHFSDERIAVICDGPQAIKKKLNLKMP